MEKSVLMGGFGGQGVQTCGKMLIKAANEEDKIATFYSVYGGVMRGGTSNCTIITSDEEIGAPNIKIVNNVVAFNIPSFNKFEPRVLPGGTMVVNSTLIDKEMYKRDDITYVEIPATELSQQLGSSTVLKIILLAFFCEYTEMISTDAARKIVVEEFGNKRPELMELNTKAFDIGVEWAVKAKKNN